MINRLFSGTIYVKVYKNRFYIRHIEEKSDVVVSSPEPFSTTRLLIGEFSKAQNALKEGIRQVHLGMWFAPSPVVLIQPMELIEGGLSEIEVRILKEVAMGAGGRSVVVWVGHELTDQEVLNKVETNGRAS